MSPHRPHSVRGTRGCNGEDVILHDGDRIPCADADPRPAPPADPRTVLDPWQDPAHWPDAPAANCPMYHGDACEGAHTLRPIECARTALDLSGKIFVRTA